MQGRWVGKVLSSILPLSAPATISWYLEGPNHRKVLLMWPVEKKSVVVSPVLPPGH